MTDSTTENVTLCPALFPFPDGDRPACILDVDHEGDHHMSRSVSWGQEWADAVRVERDAEQTRPPLCSCSIARDGDVSMYANEILYHVRYPAACYTVERYSRDAEKAGELGT